MEGTCYSIEKIGNKWIVSTRYGQVLTCQSKKAALMVVKRASDMVHNHGECSRNDGEQSDSRCAGRRR
jgi:hypothetical protein